MTNRAFIREAECIGCTKCLDVCPTDAIVGAQKFLHTVIEEDCIGCERCVPACPVDCIDLQKMDRRFDPMQLTHAHRIERKSYFKRLVERRANRLEHKKQASQQFFFTMKNNVGAYKNETDS